jgi:hypothetical protein
LDILLNKLNGIIKGVITGFDRIVFKGMLLPIMYAEGMQFFLNSRGVLNKAFKEYAMSQSAKIVESADEISNRLCGCKTIFISSSNERKETLAHEKQKETGVTAGLIGVWSCLESCYTFRSTFNSEARYPILRREKTRCKHLYFYFDDPVYGFMSIRVQTWAPYEIQIALNGREWLKRSLDANNCKYIVSGNKFLHIDDYALAQKLMDAQLDTDFRAVLNGFLPSVFPCMSEVIGDRLSYYWTLWQSETAKDYIFESPEALKPLMDDFLLYSLVTGTGDRVLKYFGAPVRPNGQPHPNSNPELMSRVNFWYDGMRVRHWNGKNSVKFYNEQNVLRFETTMNDPSKFKIYRYTEKQDKATPKKLLPMRKGIADINVRAEVSRNIINRFTNHLSAMEEKTRLGELISPITVPLIIDGRRYRALDPFGKDLELLRAISDPAFDVSGITNKELQLILKDTPWAKGMSGKQLSGRISRHLSLLRKHGLIKKLPNQRKYVLTDKGRKTTASIFSAWAASVNDLLKLAA